MCCGMFCLDGEVVFIHSKQVNKLGPSPHGGNLKNYLRGVIDSVNPEFSQSDSKHLCNRTDVVFPSYLRLSLGRALRILSDSYCFPLF